jgi:hypothetical protein
LIRIDRSTILRLESRRQSHSSATAAAKFLQLVQINALSQTTASIVGFRKMDILLYLGCWRGGNANAAGEGTPAALSDRPGKQIREGNRAPDEA